jgi:hypothetical protein
VEKKEFRKFYYNALQMEARSIRLQKVYIGVADKSSLQALLDILGVAMGLGFANFNTT